MTEASNTINDDLLVDVRGLHAGYGGIPVVRELNLTVGRGEVVALLGPVQPAQGAVHPQRQVGWVILAFGTLTYLERLVIQRHVPALCNRWLRAYQI